MRSMTATVIEEQSICHRTRSRKNASDPEEFAVRMRTLRARAIGVEKFFRCEAHFSTHVLATADRLSRRPLQFRHTKIAATA